ncbi:transketolase [Lactiplantibacillus pentosus]|uniref:Transketolase n=1 Tax=Lactiplantibacillus pentosus TaxID=1589 RepID=A0AAX6LFL5_LACPE|nr:transketolase [Lactiplantibacillus pentosus]MBU7496041.1 transketolase [Lactiplantibacillus pentosus]MCT3294898.1 transketolase [Lactiplantibacillus pentosus]MDF2313347.1 transketolase [Lactiplantibacillus pentosus]USR88101.1 transketolase [Lactiplantibacillus pentosus]WMB62093.1 transketolase [Lactiplantibacillus pentosus]
MFDKVDELGVNTIRTLSIEAIQKANSGHPGLPMGAAPMAYVLWTKHLKVNPQTHMDWVNRDRFILSAGHGSAMLYSLLHLAGYNVSIDDLKHFRQWDSRTPGHPEYGHTDGVEVTTGPLGQGFGMAVGMAMAEAHLAAQYNRVDFPIMNHYTYTIVGDGDLMEGISHEAGSLAGHLKLGKLIALYDSNGISLDGKTSQAFTENVGDRFKAYGWQHLVVEDGNDLDAINAAIGLAKKTTDRPSLIEVKTVIGYGAPKQGTNAVHGNPIGEDGIKAAEKVYGWNYSDFEVPEAVTDRFKATIQEKGAHAERQWHQLFERYEAKYPKQAQAFKAAFNGQLPTDLKNVLPHYLASDALASRAASANAINAIANAVPTLWGGAADLSSSNKTMISDAKDFQPDSYDGRNIWFGVREFGMAAAMNGIVLHGGTRVFGGTFFVFTDYLRAAVRLSALQHAPVIYVLTHDSIAVGEDGPTHEPIEQLASLRCMPNVQVIRPADGNETSAAWEQALRTTDKPTVLVLSRQALKTLPVSVDIAFDGVEKGGYVVKAAQKSIPDGLLIATGSEVNLALDAQQQLAKQNHDVSVVSIPSFDRFAQQSLEYRASVLPSSVTKRVTIEAGSTFGWDQFAGDRGVKIGVDRFGASAPGDLVLDKYGFNVDNVVKAYLKQ